MILCARVLLRAHSAHVAPGGVRVGRLARPMQPLEFLPPERSAKKLNCVAVFVRGREVKQKTYIHLYT